MEQLIGSFFTVLASGVVAALTTYSLNSSKEHIFSLRQKSEDLYVSFSSWGEAVSRIILEHYPYYKNEINLGELNSIIDQKDPRWDAYEKSCMYIAIYFPELDDKFKELVEIRSKLMIMISQTTITDKRGKLNSTIKKAAFDTFHSETLVLFNEINSFKKLISENARTNASFNAIKPKFIVAIVDKIRSTRNIPRD